jgi:hypothetical protein
MRAFVEVDGVRYLLMQIHPVEAPQDGRVGRPEVWWKNADGSVGTWPTPKAEMSVIVDDDERMPPSLMPWPSERA